MKGTRRKRWANRMFGCVFAALAGCGYPKSGAVPGPADVASARARWPDTSEAKLARGRDLFIAKCNGCHGYPDVDRIDEAKWPGILSRMGKNAHLDAAESDDVLHFVLASRAH